jgi:hypothetical protein
MRLVAENGGPVSISSIFKPQGGVAIVATSQPYRLTQTTLPNTLLSRALGSVRETSPLTTPTFVSFGVLNKTAATAPTAVATEILDGGKRDTTVFDSAKILSSVDSSNAVKLEEDCKTQTADSSTSGIMVHGQAVTALNLEIQTDQPEPGISISADRLSEDTESDAEPRLEIVSDVTITTTAEDEASGNAEVNNTDFSISGAVANAGMEHATHVGEMDSREATAALERTSEPVTETEYLAKAAVEVKPLGVDRTASANETEEAGGDEGKGVSVVVESIETLPAHTTLTGLSTRANSPRVPDVTRTTSPSQDVSDSASDGISDTFTSDTVVEDVSVRTLRSGKKRTFAARIERRSASLTEEEGSKEKRSRFSSDRNSLQDSRILRKESGKGDSNDSESSDNVPRLIEKDFGGKISDSKERDPAEKTGEPATKLRRTGVLTRSRSQHDDSDSAAALLSLRKQDPKITYADLSRREPQTARRNSADTHCYPTATTHISHINAKGEISELTQDSHASSTDSADTDHSQGKMEEPSYLEETSQDACDDVGKGREEDARAAGGKGRTGGGGGICSTLLAVIEQLRER